MRDWWLFVGRQGPSGGRTAGEGGDAPRAGGAMFNNAFKVGEIYTKEVV